VNGFSPTSLFAASAGTFAVIAGNVDAGIGHTQGWALNWCTMLAIASLLAWWKRHRLGYAACGLLAADCLYSLAWSRVGTGPLTALLAVILMALASFWVLALTPRNLPGEAHAVPLVEPSRVFAPGHSPVVRRR
jgi:hypothetical protein